jgi:hypothetical protein
MRKLDMRNRDRHMPDQLSGDHNGRSVVLIENFHTVF